MSTKAEPSNAEEKSLSLHLRIARPVSDLARTVEMYTRGLGLAQVGHFVDHNGFDGVMLGTDGADYHFEFTVCRAHPVSPTPTHEDLCVFYVPDDDRWASRCTAMLDAGFREVEPLNPYWSLKGRTFEDPDGYRVVVQCAAWTNQREA
jgi:catechol 2,3-dioxygenase-like lactoylglutathione lyase family enzyme